MDPLVMTPYPKDIQEKMNTEFNQLLKRIDNSEKQNTAVGGKRKTKKNKDKK